MAPVTDPDPGAARTAARLSATLLSHVPPPGESAEQLFVVMVKQDPRLPEEAVYILVTPPRLTAAQYRVMHVKARDSVAFRVDAAEADVTEAPIDGELTHALVQSWGAMTLGARWPEREDRIGRTMKWPPGVEYTFDYRGDNVYGQGDTVSPSAGTCSAALVNLCELLIQYADERDPTKRGAIREELLRQSRALAARLTARTP